MLSPPSWAPGWTRARRTPVSPRASLPQAAGGLRAAQHPQLRPGARGPRRGGGGWEDTGVAETGLRPPMWGPPSGDRSLGLLEKVARRFPSLEGRLWVPPAAPGPTTPPGDQPTRCPHPRLPFPSLSLSLFLILLFHFLLFMVSFFFVCFHFVFSQSENNCNIVMVFVMHQRELATGTHVSPYPEPASHLPPHPILPGCPRVPAWVSCFMHPTRTGCRFYLW